MEKNNPMKDYKQWLIVSNTEYKDDPNRASPLCIVETYNRDDEYVLHLFTTKTGMVGYDLKFHAKSFLGRIPSDCGFINLDEFIKNYYDEKIHISVLLI